MYLLQVSSPTPFLTSSPRGIFWIPDIISTPFQATVRSISHFLLDLDLPSYSALDLRNRLPLWVMEEKSSRNDVKISYMLESLDFLHGSNMSIAVLKNL